MNSLDNREKAEENKYAHEKEVEFLINARFHKLVGIWIAEKLGFDDKKTEEYKNNLITSDMSHNDKDALFNRVKHDIMINNTSVDEQEIKEKLYDLYLEAKLQINGNA
ncbi:MAG: DUF1476 domain-containing protein [Pseudomonadota bacterium]